MSTASLLALGSYGSAALANVVLALLLVTAWRGRAEGALLALAILASAAWSGLVVAFIYFGSRQGWIATGMGVTELLRDACWIVFLLRLLAGPDGWLPRQGLPRLIGISSALLVVALIIVLLQTGGEDRQLSPARLLVLAGMMSLSIIGLVLVEQLYRQAPRENLRSVKYLCCAIGGIFAYDFFLYSEGVLYNQVDYSLWGGRGVVNAIVVPLLAVAAARNPRWSVDIFVSRSAIFHSTAILGAGIYLIVMAAGGYYIRYFGGNWGGIAQAAFMFSAALFLLVLMLSDRLRSRIKIFLSKHFYSFKYDYRNEWLRFTRTLSEEGDDRSLYHRLIKAMATIVDSDGGVLWVDDGEGSFVLRACDRGGKLQKDVHFEDIGRDQSLPAFLRRTGWIIDLNEYRREPSGYEGLELPAWLLNDSESWLIVPLVSDQRLLAIIVLDQPVTLRSIDWEDCDVIKTAALQAASHLAQYEASQALGDARQFEAFNQLSAFIIHDLKNLVAQLSLLLQNAERHADDPEFVKDMIATVDNSVERMNRLLKRLRSGRQQQQNENAGIVVLPRLIERVLADKASARPRPQIIGSLPEVHVVADGDRLAMVIGHIIQNAIDATPKDGQVKVSCKVEQDEVHIDIEDNGCGMSSEFIRERLFRPFVSTKGEGNMGVGVYEARQFLRQLGGGIEVNSLQGVGTRFRLRLPLQAVSNTA